MPRKAEITIYRDGKRYVVNIPAGLSPTGKRQRLFFATKRMAEMKKESLRRKAYEYGKSGMAIKASLAEDATRAAAILEPWGITLTEAATFTAEHRIRQQASISFAELWERHRVALEGRSDDYRRKLDLLGRKLNPKIGNVLVCDLDHRTVADAVSAGHQTAHGFNAALRAISPAFNRAVREDWASENPCDRIERRNTGRHEIRFLSVEQSKKVIQSCRNFRKDKTKPEFMRKDARDCLPAICVMLFAGVRPKEMERLEWSDIDMEDRTIRISNLKAKTDRSRHFEMPDPLPKWLATIPVGERQGAIVPASWGHKWKAIRRHAGFSEIPDALRKTFVTHHLAAFGDVNATRAIIGHEVGDVLFSHYRGAVSKKQGLAFFEILPTADGENVVPIHG